MPESPRTDGYFLLKAMINLWRDGGFGDVLGHSERSWVSELMEIRNRWAHNETFTTDQAYRALDTAQLLLNACNAGEHASEIEKMRQELLRTRCRVRGRSPKRALLFPRGASKAADDAAFPWSARQRTMLKKVVTSIAKSSGCSHAAKWPPRSSSFQ